MPDTIETATSGRAKCRGCGRRIDKGELRFGERLPNPFGDGEATYWFHVLCAACRRPERFVALAAAEEVEIPDRDRMMTLAQRGVDHHRLQRLARVERDPSGRARCRNCRETIPKQGWRIALQFWEEGRFGPAGFIHPGCADAYFGGGDILFRIRQFTPDLSDEDLSEIELALQERPEPKGDD